MLSKKSKYAIKALVSLAKHYKKGAPLKISTIAEEQNIPKIFLEAILVELRNNALVHSKMGVRWIHACKTSGGNCFKSCDSDFWWTNCYVALCKSQFL